MKNSVITARVIAFLRMANIRTAYVWVSIMAEIIVKAVIMQLRSNKGHRNFICISHSTDRAL